MTLLQKYHKQRISKKTQSDLAKIKKDFGLKYPDNLNYTMKLLVIKNSIAQKSSFEKGFEAFRNRHIDMWDNLNFQERNKLFQMDFEDIRRKLNVFDFEGERIYIPIFDILFNNLYDRETAILELPQYFKLQTSFVKDTIDIDKYGLKPFAAGFAYPCLASANNSYVVYDESINTFYRINDQVVFYPLYDKATISSEDAKSLAIHLSNFDDASFFEEALEKGFIHPKLQKKVEKKRK